MYHKKVRISHKSESKLQAKTPETPSAEQACQYKEGEFALAHGELLTALTTLLQSLILFTESDFIRLIISNVSSKTNDSPFHAYCSFTSQPSASSSGWQGMMPWIYRLKEKQKMCFRVLFGTLYVGIPCLTTY